MNHTVVQQLELEARSVIRVRNGRGIAIDVALGVVWVTQEADLRDIILSAGDSFCIERDGLTLVHALERSRVALTVQPESVKGKPEHSDVGNLAGAAVPAAQ